MSRSRQAMKKSLLAGRMQSSRAGRIVARMERSDIRATFPALCRLQCGKGGRECAIEARDIGGEPGKQPKRRRGLMHAHAAAVEYARPLGGRGFEEFRLDRRIDDIGRTKGRPQ